jgi:hypothetical protein
MDTVFGDSTAKEGATAWAMAHHSKTGDQPH